MEKLSRDEVGAALELVAEDLREVEVLLEDGSRAPTSFLSEAASYLTKAGGKRIRPALVVLASMLGEGPSRAVHKTAAAIEMTHMATLYHDDVIDEADLRRGVPSVNEKWGNTMAILAGDYLLARASGLAAEVGGEVPIILADAVTEVIQGQVRELEASYDAGRTREHYFATVSGKTVPLMEASARLGALLGGCSDEMVDSMTVFGSSFGYAFQIADDLLDLTASREDLGKSPGTDLRDGVYTLPVILGLESDSTLATKLASPLDVKEVEEALVSTGAFGRALDVAQDFAGRAIEALSSAPDGAARRALERITTLVVGRVPIPPR